MHNFTNILALQIDLVCQPFQVKLAYEIMYLKKAFWFSEGIISSKQTFFPLLLLKFASLTTIGPACHDCHEI